jgi:ketosteroid isomerase-like protein
VTAEGYRELDGDRVLVPFSFDARGKTSGIEVGQVIGTRGATVFRVQNGKVVKVAQYLDRDRAYADLGLTPEGDNP